MTVELSLLGKDTNYPIFCFLLHVHQRVNTMPMLKAFNKVRIGGMFLKYLG